MNAKFSVAVFVLMLGGLSLLNLAAPSRAFSESENRYLQQLPGFSFGKLMDGKYTAELDTFVTDQFVLRDNWIGLKTLSELALGKRASNGVYFAEDGYLIEMFDSIDMEQLDKNLGFVSGFAERVRGGPGAEVSAVLVPSPSMILRDKLPAHTPEIDQAALLRRAAEAVSGFVDVSTILEQHSDEYIFFKTDHHWTSLGALYAYSAWRETQGYPAVSPGDFDSETLSGSFYGTVYSKASLPTISPDTITALMPRGIGPYTVSYDSGAASSDTMYERSFLETKDKYSAFLNSNQPLAQITTSNKNGKHLLLIKDSYANAFVQMALADFERISVIDLRYYKTSVYDYIAENSVTDVLILYSLRGFAGDTNVYYLSI